MTDLSIGTALARNSFEREAFTYYDTKRNDVLNLDLGELDGFHHHHFGVGDFDRSVLNEPPDRREAAIGAEIHRLETAQVDLILQTLTGISPNSRLLDAGSGRGGTALLIHRTTGCQVDGVNFSPYQNDFARRAAQRHGYAAHIQFHDRNMTDTAFSDALFDYVVSNETTMYVDVFEAFREFARILRPGGRYTLLTWCRNDSVASGLAEADAIDAHYRCHTHRRSTYLNALLAASLIPDQVDDFTIPAIPYWELRSESELATGIEHLYLDGYRNDRLNYIRITSRKSSTH